MRLIISGGGTGGHIYPALTIARAISSMEKSEILFVGTSEGLEADIIPKEGFAFDTIDVRGLERKLSFRNIVTVFKTAASLWQARRILGRFKPDIVIGTGGYVCGPVLLAASLMGIPTLIQEQNVIPGITNKLLGRFVDKIAVGYGDAAKYFANPEKIIETGNPIRQEVLLASKEQGQDALKLDEGKITILVAGGSRGARSINNAMLEVHHYFSGNKNVQILHVTGQSEYNSIVDNFRQIGIELGKAGNIIIKPYLYNMPQALAAADIAIFRAGAIGLAELTARGIPSILIPYPHAAENHQEFNARVLERQGAAVVIRDAELTGKKLIEELNKLLDNQDKMRSMAAASKSLGRPEAADRIAHLALTLAGEKSRK